jgi:antitoxin (DNA-binding transcriptional repressor) of toxin-antitoxin stability system|tara:strand:+ start:255 stop:479 length:225 start_codon:yes stop_codon:yes gene_type:complete
MKQATVRELRNEFSKVSKWLDAGETVQILKRGKPVGRLTPEPQQKTFLGACPSPYPIPDDIDAPVDVEWEAAKK